MSAIAPSGEKTGMVDRDEWTALHEYLLDDGPTGYEYDAGLGYEVFVVHFLGLESAALGEELQLATVEDDLRGRAAALAAETPHVSVAPPFRPKLSGDLAADVHEVCGLTWRQIAEAFAISERAVASWRAQGVPRHRTQTMEALRAIGTILVGGLGPVGVSTWLTSGSPSRIERIRDGELEEIAAEANAYRDTPAT